MRFHLNIAVSARTALLAAVIGLASPAFAQQPSASSIAIAKEIITIKGAAKMYEPIVPGVIEQAKATFLQTNPMLGRDLNEVAASLRTEFAGKIEEMNNEVARLYASRFTEQELKDALAFYKSPLGKKMVDEEPKVIDESMAFGQQWANRFSDEIVVKMRAAMKKKGHDI